MRKAIFVKFIQVLFVALLINSAVFYIVTSTVLLKNAREDMGYTIEILDHTLDYSGDLTSQVKELDSVLLENNSRITIIREDGTVAADTGVDNPSKLENHLKRAEVSDALHYGKGDSRRYSDTLKESMLYVAIRSGNSSYILRLAMPYHGVSEYLIMLLPAVWLSFAVALLVSAGAADKFSQSVTKPLHEISMEMARLKGDYRDLSFESCKYPEINIIADTTMQMSKNVGEYLEQIELERQIRQEFFSNASHELKTPITSIQGYAELMESGMVQDETVKLDFIRRIKKEAVNMTNLINDILMISKLETKEAEVVKSDVRISLVLEDVLQSLAPLMANQEVLAHVDCKPISIRANVQQMRELCGNLISNAVKYNHPGGQVWIKVSQEDHDMVLSVRDNGVGIPEESTARIFERFYRVDKGRNKKQGGTGLGLSIVKHIVNFYHGTITVKSAVDHGTEFVVRLPLR